MTECNNCNYSIEQKVMNETSFALAQEAMNVANLAKAKSVVAITAMPNVATMSNTIKCLQNEVSTLKDELAIMRDQMAIIINERHESIMNHNKHQEMVKCALNDWINEYCVDRFNDLLSQVQEKNLFNSLIKTSIELLIPYVDDNINNITFIKKRFNSVLYMIIFDHLAAILGINNSQMYRNKSINEKFKLEVDRSGGVAFESSGGSICDGIDSQLRNCNQYPMAIIVNEIMIKLKLLYDCGQLDCESNV